MAVITDICTPHSVRSVTLQLTATGDHSKKAQACLTPILQEMENFEAQCARGNNKSLNTANGSEAVIWHSMAIN